MGGGSAKSLQCRHNWHDGVSNHQPHDCLLNRLFRRRSKKTSKLRVTGLCEGNLLVTREFPTQMASNAENVSIWWRHHVNHKLMLKMKKAQKFRITDPLWTECTSCYPQKGSIMRSMCPWHEIIMEVRLNRPENNTSLMVKSPTSSCVKHCSARQIYILPSFRCEVRIMCDIVISYFSLLSTYIYIGH